MMVKNRILKFLITDTDDYVGDFTYSPVFPYIGIFKQFFFFFCTNKLPVHLDYADVLKFGFVLLHLFWRRAGPRQLSSVTITAPTSGSVLRRGARETQSTLQRQSHLSS